jgi:hypothetical protein
MHVKYGELTLYTPVMYIRMSDWLVFNTKSDMCQLLFDDNDDDDVYCVLYKHVKLDFFLLSNIYILVWPNGPSDIRWRHEHHYNTETI